jgi:hypothetical protein
MISGVNLVTGVFSLSISHGTGSAFRMLAVMISSNKVYIESRS